MSDETEDNSHAILNRAFDDALPDLQNICKEEADTYSRSQQTWLIVRYVTVALLFAGLAAAAIYFANVKTSEIIEESCSLLLSRFSMMHNNGAEIGTWIDSTFNTQAADYYRSKFEQCVQNDPYGAFLFWMNIVAIPFTVLTIIVELFQSLNRRHDRLRRNTRIFVGRIAHYTRTPECVAPDAMYFITVFLIAVMWLPCLIEAMRRTVFLLYFMS